MIELEKMRIHHIGYLVKNIVKSKDLFLKMGYRLSKDNTYDKFRDVDICFLEKDGYCIELVSPRTTDSVVGELRKKLGNTPYHICYEVDDLEDVISELGKQRFVIWEEPHEAPAIEGRRVAFLVNSQIGMIELLESK